MSVESPPTHSFYHPILAHLATVNEPAHRQTVIDRVADILDLDDEQRARLANDQIPSHAYRSGWSLSVLKKAGLLTNPSDGYWALRDKGRDLLARFPLELDKRSIAKIKAVWWTKKQEAEISAVAGTGQGTGLTPSQRKAVELYAMRKAEEYLSADGWACKDSSSNKPYDYVALRKGQTIFVEVKGTTGNGQSIMLTANEADIQQQKHPNNALIVVHPIMLNHKSDPPIASRGQVRAIIPWLIVQSRLIARAYQYQLDE